MSRPRRRRRDAGDSAVIGSTRTGRIVQDCPSVTTIEVTGSSEAQAPVATRGRR